MPPPELSHLLFAARRTFRRRPPPLTPPVWFICHASATSSRLVRLLRRAVSVRALWSQVGGDASRGALCDQVSRSSPPSPVHGCPRLSLCPCLARCSAIPIRSLAAGTVRGLVFVGRPISLHASRYVQSGTEARDALSASASAQRYCTTIMGEPRAAPPSPGYWGPVTSSLEWCEENYTTTHYVGAYTRPAVEPTITLCVHRAAPATGAEPT